MDGPEHLLDELLIRRILLESENAAREAFEVFTGIDREELQIFVAARRLLDYDRRYTGLHGESDCGLDLRDLGRDERAYVHSAAGSPSATSASSTSFASFATLLASDRPTTPADPLIVWKSLANRSIESGSKVPPKLSTSRIDLFEIRAGLFEEHFDELFVDGFTRCGRLGSDRRH